MVNELISLLHPIFFPSTPNFSKASRSISLFIPFLSVRHLLKLCGKPLPRFCCLGQRDDNWPQDKHLRASSLLLSIVQKRLNLSYPRETAVNISFRKTVVQFFSAYVIWAYFINSVISLECDSVIYSLFYIISRRVVKWFTDITIITSFRVIGIFRNCWSSRSNGA
jgi:hypothetical protein